MREILGLTTRVVVSLLFVFTNVSPLQAVPVVKSSNGTGIFLSGVKLSGDDLVFSWKNEKAQVKEVSPSQAKEILSYFYSALTIPDENRWVDLFILNTDEDVMGPGLEWTKLGYAMIDADLRMKVRINELMDPDSEVGAVLWNKLADLGITNFMPRFWMVPGEIEFYSDEDSIYVRSAKIEVKVEIEDKGLDSRIKKRVKEIVENTIVPVLEEEINESPEFAELRKAYYSMILASWVKNRAKEGLVSDKLASIIDSYVLPDVGLVRVDRWAFLREFNRHFLFGRMDGSFLSVMGGGEDFTNIKDGLGKTTDDSTQSGIPEKEEKKDKVKKTKTSVPAVSIKGNPNVLENTASRFGIDPVKNVVGIFGGVEFHEVKPQKVIGLNVLLINLSPKPLEVNESFIKKYSSKHQFFEGLSNVIIVKTPEGKIVKQSLPSNNLEITEENAIAFLDTIAKVLFQKKKLMEKFEGLKKVGLVFSQRPGEEIETAQVKRIKEVVGEDSIMLLNQSIPSSSTRVREGKGNHLVVYPIYEMLCNIYFPRWSAYEKLKDKEEKGILTEEEEKRLFQMKSMMDKQMQIASKLMEKIEAAVDAVKRGHNEKLSEIDEEIERILKNGLKLGPRKVVLNGYGVHLIGSILVQGIEEAVEKNEKGLVDYLMKMRRENLYDYNKELVQAEYFANYEQVDTKKNPVEQIELGEKNMKRMIVDNAKAVFRIEVNPDTLEPEFKKKLEGLWGKLKEKLAKKKEILTQIEDIKNSKKPEKLPVLADLREELKEEYKENAIYQDLKTFLDIKEMELAYRDIMRTFGEVKKRVKEGKVDPERKDLRIAYLPMKGDPWQLGHIWVIAKLLATGEVDKVIVTVDNGDPRKPELSDGMVRGPISEILLNRIFGGFVEFSTLPFDRPELFKKTGEEMIIDLVDHFSKKYGEEGKRICVFYYLAGSDHASFLNMKKIAKKQEAKNKEIKKENEKRKEKNMKPLPMINVNSEISTFLKKINKMAGLNIGFDKKLGLLVIPSSDIPLKGPADELKLKNPEDESGWSAIRRLLEGLNVPPEKIVNLDDLLDDLDEKTQKRLSEALFGPGKSVNLEDKNIPEALRELIRQLRQKLGVDSPNQGGGKSAPTNPGGLLLSEISIE